MKKYLVLGSLASVMLLVGGGAAYMALAQTSSTQVTACARPNGDIYLIGPNFSRQSCQGQQVQISWPTLAGAPKQLHLYDGNNQDLGIVLSGSGQQSSLQVYSVYVPAHGLVIDYGVGGPEEISANIVSANHVYYSNSDCTGQAFAVFNDGQSGMIYMTPQMLIGVGGRYFKKEVEMHPMNAYERRVIHAALTEYPDITTESVGEEPQRRVVIKPL